MTVAPFSNGLAHALAFWVIVTAYLFLFFGFDDLVFDFSFWMHTIRKWFVKRNFKAITIAQLRAKEPQRIAIYVPCWHEDQVVEKMVELACSTAQYQSYTIFLGVCERPGDRDEGPGGGSALSGAFTL